MAQFSLMALVIVALVGRQRWPELLLGLRANFWWIILAYVMLTVAARLLERRRRRQRQTERESP